MRYLLPYLLFILLCSLPAEAQITAGNSCNTGDTTFYAGTYFTCPSGAWVQQTITSTVKVGTTTAVCNSGNAGLLRMSGSNLQYCNGTFWLSVSGIL